MRVKIHPIPLGVTNCYLLEGDGVILIDAGMPGQAGAFQRALERITIPPSQVRLLLITHAHWDHIGSAGPIQERTGAPIAVHCLEEAMVENAAPTVPPATGWWGKVMLRVIGAMAARYHIPPALVSIPISNQGMRLDGFGIPGEVLYTPGHSMGSVSVLLDSGEAFVGDLAMNALPMRLTPGFPIIAESMEQVKESWKMLLERGAKTAYPAHGKSFSVEHIRRALAR